MDEKEIDIRNIAAKTFMDNFDKQLDIALPETQTEEDNSELANTHKKSKEYQYDGEFNLLELEEAIADIEEYLQTKKKHQPPSASE